VPPAHSSPPRCHASDRSLSPAVIVRRLAVLGFVLVVIGYLAATWAQTRDLRAELDAERASRAAASATASTERAELAGKLEQLEATSDRQLRAAAAEVIRLRDLLIANGLDPTPPRHRG
jgi:hypothetical protein